MSRKKQPYSDGPGVTDAPKPWNGETEDLRRFPLDQQKAVQQERANLEHMQSMKQIASDLGLTLEQWMEERARRIAENEGRAGAKRVIPYEKGRGPEGPFLDGSEEWHEEYKALCMANVTAILAGQMTRQEAANAVLDRFPRLSDSARAMWCRLANSAPERPGIEINPVWKEGTKHAPAAGVRELSPRASELAKEIISEVERKMRIGAA